MNIPNLSKNYSIHSSQQYEKRTNQTIQDGKSTLMSSSKNISVYCTLLDKTKHNNHHHKLYSSTATHKAASNHQKSEFCEKHLCLIHKKKLAYDCMICKQALCADCLIQGKQHRGHRFQKYNQKKQDLKLKCNQFRKQINFKKIHLNKITQNLLKNLKPIQIQKQNSQIPKLYYHKNRIQQTQLQQLFLLQNQCTSFKKVLQQFDGYYEQSLSQLKNTTKVSLISQTGRLFQSNLLTKIKQISQINIRFPQYEFQNYTKPNFYVDTFAVTNFTKIKQTNNQKIFQCFQAYNSLWRLKVYPNGYPGAKINETKIGIEYLSIYIQRIDGILEKSEYIIQIQITSTNDSRLKIQKQFKSEFIRKESWGYDRYMRVSNIYDYGFLGDNDTLLIKISISPANFYQACLALNQVIIEKQRIQQQNQRKIKILKIMLEKKRKNNQTKSPNEEFNTCQISKYQQNNPQNSIKHFDNIQKKVNSFKKSIYQKIKEEGKNNIVDSTGSINLMRNTRLYDQQFPSNNLVNKTTRLIRLVSSKNVELIENSRKKYHNRSNTFY